MLYMHSILFCCAHTHACTPQFVFLFVDCCVLDNLALSSFNAVWINSFLDNINNRFMAFWLEPSSQWTKDLIVLTLVLPLGCWPNKFGICRSRSTGTAGQSGGASVVPPAQVSWINNQKHQQQQPQQQDVRQLDPNYSRHMQPLTQTWEDCSSTLPCFQDSFGFCPY